MSELVAENDRLLGMSITDRVAMAKSLVSEIQKSWRRLAEVLWSLKKDGYDTGELGIPLCGYLEKCARGVMLIEAIELWCGNIALLRRISKLPLIDQRKLIIEKAIAVVEGSTHRMIPLDSIGDEQLKTAIEMSGCDAKIRSIQEQYAKINEEKLLAKKKHRKPIIHDPNADTIDTNGPRSRKELLAWLRESGLHK